MENETCLSSLINFVALSEGLNALNSFFGNILFIHSNSEKIKLILGSQFTFFSTI